MPALGDGFHYIGNRVLDGIVHLIAKLAVYSSLLEFAVGSSSISSESAELFPEPFCRLMSLRWV